MVIAMICFKTERVPNINSEDIFPIALTCGLRDGALDAIANHLGANESQCGLGRGDDITNSRSGARQSEQTENRILVLVIPNVVSAKDRMMLAPVIAVFAVSIAG